MSLRSLLWAWPDGLVWKTTNRFTVNSRRWRFELFMREMSPLPSWRVLDVGVSNFLGRATNFFEEWYPWRGQITAFGYVGEENFTIFQQKYPEVKLVLGDGRCLPFTDKSFDVVFSNAVLEHVGSKEWQKRFVQECTRVGRRVFIATPNRGFPIDAHTLIPFAHWLPQTLRFQVYRMLGRGYWADPSHLNLLTRREFADLFPEGVMVKIIEQKSIGMCTTLIGITGT